MNLKLYLLIICLVIVSTRHINAQVTVGANTPPKDYAILQIEGKGGLRLPRLNNLERATLQSTFDANANGLVIYYDDENCFQFWNGSAWISMKFLRNLEDSENGITGNEKYKLGGDLKENTTIAQGTKNLFFDASTGTFSVSNNAFVITSLAIGIGKVPTDALLDVKAEAAGTGFRYNPAEAQTGYVLTSDKDGYGTWQDLTPNPYRTTGTIKSNTVISNATSETPVQISDALPLTKGVWLIIGRYIAISTGTASTANYGYNSWLRLRKTGTTNDISTIGQVPQRNSSGQVLTTPQLVYIVEVPESGASYELWGDVRYGGTPNITINKTHDTYGDSFFHAIRLTE